MHLLVPFVSDLSEACQHVLHDLALPNLDRLLGLLSQESRDEGDAYSFSPPHERALAQSWGWQGGDGTLPFAARAAVADSIAVGDLAWALLTPAHWQLGRDHVTLLDPEELQLDAAESRALFESLRGLLEGDGFTAAWGGAGRWYAGRADLDGLATASLDRVIGRSVDLWLRESAGSRRAAPRAIHGTVRRLQSEAQLLFHTHGVNEAREGRGALAVNSFWLSGCGCHQAANSAATPAIVSTLRTPLLGADWAAWAEAWRELDAGAVARLLATARSGESVTITLCGERAAARLEARPRSLLQRVRRTWQRTEARTMLATL